MNTVEQLLKKVPDRHAPSLPAEPDLGIEYGGRRLTPAETARLIRNSLSSHNKELDLPDESKRKLAECLLDWQEAGVFALAYHHVVVGHALAWGDAATVLRLESQLSDARFVPPGFAEALARAKGAAALLWLRDRLHLWAGQYLAKEFEALRGTVIRVPVFDLLAKPQPAKQWPALQLSGFRFTAEEFRACVMDPAHREFLAGTVLELRGAGEPRFVAFPCEPADSETVAIAHPATTPDSARAAGARFNQWAFDAQSVDWRSLEVSPVRLFLRLEAQGWSRGRVDDDGLLRRHERAFPELGLTAVVEYDGVPLRAPGDWAPQRLRELRYESEAHPIAVAQVMRDLAELAR